MDNVVVRELIDAGIHFGHRVGRWNPKMKPYIFCSRNSIHIINIKETLRGLIRAKKFLGRMVASGKDILIVGTKRQARQPVMEQANRCGMPYVIERWLGGTLTNFRTIRSRLGRLEELEEMDAKGLMAAESKKMESTLRREMRKIRRNLGGIRTMDRMPGALVIIDARREHNAVDEARKLGIPTICLMDTDSDPDIVDLPIPGNDDAMRVIELVLAQLADAVLEGKSGRQESDESEEARRGRSRRISVARAAEVMANPGRADGPESPTGAAPSAAPADAAVATDHPAGPPSGPAKPQDPVEPPAGRETDTTADG
ncbi:MAG: 30S ribosomal protein S2 [Sedimentisphaerales bacterium]|nr:30S ribosomal protein S2 [Sedimentisphaerales bacterium]